MKTSQFRTVVFLVVFLVTVAVHHAAVRYLAAQILGCWDVDGMLPAAATYEKIMYVLLLPLSALVTEQRFIVISILAACIWGAACAVLATLVHAIAIGKNTS